MIQLPFAVYRVVIYVIFSGHILVALSASEASFILVAKKITRISHVVCWIPTMPQRYEHQILYMHFAAHHAHTHTHTRLRGRGAEKASIRVRPFSSSFGKTG